MRKDPGFSGVAVAVLAPGFGVNARTLVERLDAGESLNDVAADYELTPELMECAVLERAARVLSTSRTDISA